MLLRVCQVGIFIAVAWANIYFGWTPNGYVVAGIAVVAAYALTVFPLSIVDWWNYRGTRRQIDEEKKAAGMTYGWRRHLPWNAKKPG